MSNRRRPMLRHNSIAVGLRAFFVIMDKWGVSNDDAKKLLGQPGKSTFHNWKSGDVGDRVAGEFDLASRISYVLGIFRALELAYSRPDLADSWVRKPNKAFGGQSALERMAAGQIVDLAAVRDYLDSVVEG